MKPFPVLLGLGLAFQAGLSPLAALDLVRDGRPACTIVLAEKPTPSARFAALEIRAHVLQATGADLPIRTDAEAVEGARLLVGDSAATRSLGFVGAGMPSQEYLVAFRSNAVVLLGRDWLDTPENRREEGRSTGGERLQDLRHTIDYAKAVGLPALATGPVELPGLYDDQGTCLAAYDFLERHLGVRWYGPNPLNVVVPARKDLAAQGPDIRRAPGLKHRSALPAGNWPFLKGQWGEFDREQVVLYWRRIRQGGERWAGNHTFFPQTIQAAFQDPEFENRNPKGRGSQLCYSSPRLVEKVAGMARDFFDGRGSLVPGWKAMGDHFALVPDDNMHLCTCDRCQALLKPAEVHRSGQFASGEMSDYWFSFVNAVAREVGKTHPDRKIATLAYWAYSKPPSFPLEPNVSVSPCLQTCYFPVQKEVRELETRWYTEWQQAARPPLFLWVYYHHPMEPALIDRWKCFPHVTVHETARRHRGFVRDGVHGIYECGEQDQLEQYVLAKVWDDPDLDVDAVVAGFFRDAFGPAAEPMKRFYLRLEEIANDPANYPEPIYRKGGIQWRKAAWETLGTGARMDELGGLIAEADRLAATPAEKQRVKQWRTALWDWMRDGRELHRRATAGGS